MVPSLARQAVIIKSGNNTSVITGNYDLSYALGLIVNQSGILFPGDYSNLQDLQNRKSKTYVHNMICRLKKQNVGMTDMT